MLYTALQVVNLRREPRVVEYKIGKNYITNRVGQLSAGTQREILETISNKAGQTWGRVSDPDAAGIAVWVCIRTINSEMMRQTEVVIPSDSADPAEARLKRLESWARSMGWQG